MRIVLHAGPTGAGAARLQAALLAARRDLARMGILVPVAPGRRNHTRLMMAALDPGHVEPLRQARGFGPEDRQAALAAAVRSDLAAEIAEARPRIVVLSVLQAAECLWWPGEVERLADLLGGMGVEIGIVLNLAPPAEALAEAFAARVLGGRCAPLARDLALAAKPDWRAAVDGVAPRMAPEIDLYPEIEAPPRWLDPGPLLADWRGVFGHDRVTALPPPAPGREGAALAALLGLERPPAAVQGVTAAPAPSAATLGRVRALNPHLRAAMARGWSVPRRLRARIASGIAIAGPPLDPATLAPTLTRLTMAWQAATGGWSPPPASATWSEPAADHGFDPEAALAAAMPAIRRATSESCPSSGRSRGRLRLSPGGEALLTPASRDIHARLVASRLAPHNRIDPGPGDAQPFPDRPLAATDRPRRVIVACMKDEGPYIVEWIAHHRAIGFDGFLIFTNDCSDGTDAILDGLQRNGIVERLANDEWKGKSPQQAALNRAIRHPMVARAEWIAHIDVDEFVNVRTGEGRLDDLFAAVPEATHIAMPWRLFGHGGVERIEDAPVIEQFTRCAPAFCPKPHTAWGFKTLGRNLGAYAKLSCHRPNKLNPDRADAVRWVGGSGRPMGEEVKTRGWRATTKTIGYDLVQLNHYALRSADSYLVKRARGRALHVDREIGANYWVRMDWNDHEERSIQRNLPRLRAEMARLLADEGLATLHREALAWHRARAAEIAADPDAAALREHVLSIRLTQSERAAYALTLDTES